MYDDFELLCAMKLRERKQKATYARLDSNDQDCGCARYLKGEGYNLKTLEKRQPVEA